MHVAEGIQISVRIELPFSAGDTIIELGGGDKPTKLDRIKVINIDKRQVSGVDIVRDLEQDFSDIGVYDGVFAKYMAEHISWRKIATFLKSCFNILKDGKSAIFIVPDTEAQMKLALSKEFDLGTSEMIFGGQDYSDNNHKVAFSKSFITKLLKDAGFSEVMITDHPDPNARDIIVVAKKSTVIHSVVDGKPVYEEAYFTNEAYTYGGYRDFPVHELTVDKILERKPKSVIELGGARGYLCKKLSDRGVPATCLDISNYCYSTRATDDFVRMDLAKEPIPKKDKEYDLAFSIAFLEHIPEEDLNHVISESMRVSKRGLHGITFTITPEDIDQTHKLGTIKPIEWWKERFKFIDPNYPVEIVDKEDLERYGLSATEMMRYLRGEINEGEQS